MGTLEISIRMQFIIRNSNFKVKSFQLNFNVDILSYSHLETMLFSGLEESKNS